MKTVRAEILSNDFVNPDSEQVLEAISEIEETAVQVAERWGVSVDTVRRDIRLLEELQHDAFVGREKGSRLNKDQVLALAQVRALRNQGYRGSDIVRKIVG